MGIVYLNVLYLEYHLPSISSYIFKVTELWYADG